MTRSNSRSTSSTTRRQTILETQPWEAIKWFWRFSKFYGRYVPADNLSKQQLIHKSV